MRVLPAPGFDYTFVSDTGRVFSTDPGNRGRGQPIELKQHDNGRGYVRVVRGKRHVCVHFLVAAVFLGPRPNGMEINHKDGNKLNNHVENLEYVTRAQNMQHCHAMGMSNPRTGEAHHNWRFSEAQRDAIRWDYLALKDSRSDLPRGAMRHLMEKYGISDSSIRIIVRERRWSGRHDQGVQRWKQGLLLDLFQRVGADSLPGVLGVPIWQDQELERMGKPILPWRDVA